jgi:hypothetical protein
MHQEVTDSRRSESGRSDGHHRHCFIVMPYGRTPPEIRWFKGWYDVVIKPAVISAGYDPKLSAAEEQPNAINDEIRVHLAFDPMVVVDLGGAVPDADPNPNVMYELGIRHALNLPVVMMAWKDQHLPFDVGNQRVIKEARDLLDLEVNRSELVAFIKAAESGNFYRPMEAVGRVAELEAASDSLSQDSVLGALVNEIRDLRERVTAVARFPKAVRPRPFVVRNLLTGEKRALRRQVYNAYVEAGGSPQSWSKVLQIELPSAAHAVMASWSYAEWKDFVKQLAIEKPRPSQEADNAEVLAEPASQEESNSTTSIAEDLRPGEAGVSENS